MQEPRVAGRLGFVRDELPGQRRERAGRRRLAAPALERAFARRLVEGDVGLEKIEALEVSGARHSRRKAGTADADEPLALLVSIFDGHRLESTPRAQRVQAASCQERERLQKTRA